MSRNLVKVQSFKNKNEKYWPNYIYITERIDGVKNTVIVKEPTIRFYATKPEFAPNYSYSVPAIPTSEVDEYEVKYNFLEREMVKLIGNYSTAEMEKAKQFMSECMSSGKNRGNLKLLHDYRYFHGTDIDISDHYIARYIKKYGSDGTDDINIGATLKKAFWDIEVNGRNYDRFPDPTVAPCPVNAISYYNEINNTLYGIFLDEFAEENPLIAEFRANRLEAFKKEARDEFEAMATKHFQYKGGLKLEIKFFSKEIDLLKFFFSMVNDKEVSPDILLAWNQSFDLQTVINRMIILGVDPADVICPPEFADIKQVYYREDSNARDIKAKRDRCTIASDVMYSDSMFNYIQLRASMAARDSYSLDAILGDELGDSKADLEGVSIMEIAYVNYERFVYYSLKDTFAIFVMDSKIGDTDQLYGIANKTRTRFNKGMTKTTSLRNFAIDFYEKNGWVLSNNRNVLKKNFEVEVNSAEVTEDSGDDSFRGA